MDIFCSSIHSNKCVLHKRYTTSAKIALPSVSARYEAAGRDGRAMEGSTVMAAVRRGDSAVAAELGSQSLFEWGRTLSSPGRRRQKRSSSRKQQAPVINCLLNLKLSPSPFTLFFSLSLSIYLVSFYIYRELTTLALRFNCWGFQRWQLGWFISLNL
jgi:hypothetical protein